MRIQLILVAAFGLSVVACDEVTEPEAVVRGRAHYELYCALCHGVEGEGNLSPRANALNNSDFLATASDEFLYMAITQGRPGTKMSPFGAAFFGPLDNEMVQDLIAFIRHWSDDPMRELTEPAVSGDPVAAKEVYATKCALCHGDDGEGNTALSLNNPVFLKSASDAFLEYSISKGRTKTAMIGYEGFLTFVEINNLVALIRSWETDVTHELPEQSLADCPELNVVGDIANGEPVWEEDGDLYESNESVHRAYAGGKPLIMLDARPPGDYLWEHIEGAVSMPYYDVEKCFSVLPKDTWVVTYCACPHNESEHAANILLEHGYEKVRVLNEGYIEWKEAGYPITVTDSGTSEVP